MQCRVCGVCEAVYYKHKRMTMCAGCAEDTPDKITIRVMFDRLYWGINYEDVPDNIRREFYSDYLHSTHTFDQYVTATTEDA